MPIGTHSVYVEALALVAARKRRYSTAPRNRERLLYTGKKKKSERCIQAKENGKRHCTCAHDREKRKEDDAADLLRDRSRPSCTKRATENKRRATQDTKSKSNRASTAGHGTTCTLRSQSTKVAQLCRTTSCPSTWLPPLHVIASFFVVFSTDLVAQKPRRECRCLHSQLQLLFRLQQSSDRHSRQRTHAYAHTYTHT